MYGGGCLFEGLVVERVGRLLCVGVLDGELSADRVVLCACVFFSD